MASVLLLLARKSQLVGGKGLRKSRLGQMNGAKHECLFQQNIQKKERKKSSRICRNRYVIEVLGEGEGVGADIRVFGSVRLQRVQGGGGGGRVCVSIGVGI